MRDHDHHGSGKGGVKHADAGQTGHETGHGSLGRRLRDAKPGERLVDADGDIWQRCVDGTAVVVFIDEVIEWTEDDFDEAEENFGPFLPAPAGYDDPVVLRAMRRVTLKLLPSVGG